MDVDGSSKNSLPVIIAGGIGAGVGVSLGLLLFPNRGFWQGMVAVGAGTVIGLIMGRLVGSVLFPRSYHSTSAAARIPQELSERVKGLARDPSRNIEAIRCYREETGADLFDAKDAIEGYLRSLNQS